MRLALLLLVVAVGAACASTPRLGDWTVSGAPDKVTEADALELVSAARHVYGPGTRLEEARQVALLPDLSAECAGPIAFGFPKLHYAGCAFACGGVCVLWPHPKHPGCTSLADCSALAHELAHVAGAQTEDQADAGGLLIVQEFRRRRP